MSNPTPKLNNIYAKPTLKDLLDLVKKSVFLNLNCCHLGTIQKFSPTLQKADVSINYTKTFNELDPATGQYSLVQKSYAVLLDLPLFILGGGDAQVTMPVAVGDTCLVIFNDRAIDNWYQSGQVNQSPSSTRLHSFADGIAFVGIRAANNPVEAYDAVRAVLRNGNAMVGVGTELLKLSNETYSLGAILQELVTDIKNLVTATAAITVTCALPGSPSSVPINAAAIAAVTASLTATATKLTGLLE